MTDHVEQIKSRLDIVDVISGYLKVQKSGINFKARCPFHNEKSPSFYISPERQIWHCFGCAKGGDMFSFIKDIEGVEFPEALRILANRAGVELERFDPKHAQEKDRKGRLFDACELATKFFEKQLHQSKNGKLALAYLKDRGLTDETVNDWRLGFAPDDWHALGTFLSDCGYSEREIIDAGLAVPKEASRSYDRFRSRITFPIVDANGQVVGFTARVFSLPGKEQVEEGAKYINTPQTAIYDKSRVLFGLAKSKLEVKQQDRCLLVEGNMDAIMSYQAGVKNVVATSGTALTPFQLRLLSRYTANLDFCFDTDQAGALATRRGIGLALSQSFTIRIIRLADPECKDPADYVKKYGAGWVTAAADAKPAIEFYLDRSREQFDPRSAESKKNIIAVLAPLINRLASKVERAHWVSHLAAFLRANEEAIEHDIAAAKDDLGAYDTLAEERKAAIAPILEASRPDVLQEALLSVVMKNTPLFAPDLRHITYDHLHPRIVEVFNMIKEAGASGIEFTELLKKSRPEPGADGSYTLEFAYLKSQELWKDVSDKELRAEFSTLLDKIKHKAIASQLASLEFDMKEAEVKQDPERIKELVEKFTVLTRELVALHKA